MTRENCPVSLRGFQVQAHYGAFDNGSHGGVVMMMRQDNRFRAIHPQAARQVKAVRSAFTRPYTVASIYLPPHNLDIIWKI